ncbi:hypothetical protein VNO78_09044 [Psophocarpus tetragonolobus]|uniref:N-acetyltransferase domain-containing protein n=1 Tax=Psophocarpus tetragonolobus TaxID=3891 RepID=A0AAN9XTB7_PSOTE
MSAAASTLLSVSFPICSQKEGRVPSFNFKVCSSLEPFQTGARFLSDAELRRLRSLESFLYQRELPSGSLSVRVMRPNETDATVVLLADSFAESMLLPSAYVKFLAFLVKQYLLERRTLMPHTATLVAFYTTAYHDQQHTCLAGTVELCFDARGSNASLPSPTPPRDMPYISNMAVLKSLRRRGIGWHLLMASEQLISQITSSTHLYLHCRIIDHAPFNMYSKADYKIVKTDSLLVLLMLQRRKHLMCKTLPLLTIPPPPTDLSLSDI